MTLKAADQAAVLAALSENEFQKTFDDVTLGSGILGRAKRLMMI